MNIPSKPPAESPASAQAKTSSGVVLAILACIAALCLAFLLAVGIAVGGYFLSRTERARAQREAAEADKAVAAAFQETAIAIDDATSELLDARAEGDRMVDQAHELLDRFEDLVETDNVDRAELRTWTRGEFVLEARFVKLDGEHVVLQKADGAEVRVPLVEISSVDQCIATMAEPPADSTAIP